MNFLDYKKYFLKNLDLIDEAQVLKIIELIYDSYEKGHTIFIIDRKSHV